VRLEEALGVAQQARTVELSVPRPEGGELSPQLQATRPIGDQPARVAQEHNAVRGVSERRSLFSENRDRVGCKNKDVLFAVGSLKIR
jgi:hypothetical protein